MVKNPPANAGDIRRREFDLWVRKTPVFLPGESLGQRSLVGYSPQGPKESDTTERLYFHLFQIEEKPDSHYQTFVVPNFNDYLQV